ncbi:MAG: lytic transglycosylase domain-containing protein [Defluviitaleaceae bacterium]|nr:lytic transglycosylase domain-containing protein [Defluviitaleaceae bacterium]
MTRKTAKKIKILIISFGLLGVLLAAAGIFVVQLYFPIRHLEIIKQNAGNFEPAFILAVIHAESSFRPYVVSHRGARGLMQVMDETGEWVANMMNFEYYNAETLFIPEDNIAIGSYFLNWLWRYFDGDKTLILSGYNAGIGNVNRWLQDERFSEDGLTLSYIPFLETRNYIQRVQQRTWIYTQLLRFYGLFSGGG